MPPAGTGIGDVSQSGSEKSPFCVNDIFGVAASAASTTIEKSIWNVSLLPQPPSSDSAWICAALVDAGSMPETSASKNIVVSK